MHQRSEQLNDLILNLSQTLDTISYLFIVFPKKPPEPPAFTVKPESQNASPGSNIVIKSAFTGTAPLVVKWFREEKEIFTGGKCFIKKDASSSSLELHSVKPSDSAKYTCQISNDAGKVDCTAVLFVKGAVSFSLLNVIS